MPAAFFRGEDLLFSNLRRLLVATIKSQPNRDIGQLILLIGFGVLSVFYCLPFSSSKLPCAADAAGWATAQFAIMTSEPPLGLALNAGMSDQFCIVDHLPCSKHSLQKRVLSSAVPSNLKESHDPQNSASIVDSGSVAVSGHASVFRGAADFAAPAGHLLRQHGAP